VDPRVDSADENNNNLEAQEGYSRRRQGAAIAAARREAAEAKVKAEVLLEKMKTMEATLNRVAAMLPSLERLQRREDAATTKIQAALRGYAKRKEIMRKEKQHLQVAAMTHIWFFKPHLRPFMRDLRPYLRHFSENHRRKKTDALEEVYDAVHFPYGSDVDFRLFIHNFLPTLLHNWREKAPTKGFKRFEDFAIYELKKDRERAFKRKSLVERQASRRLCPALWE
jgi:hypothetical protein